VDTAGRPIVAFESSDGSQSNIYVQRYEGASQKSLGGAINPVSGQNASGGDLSMVVDGMGIPVVAVAEASGPGLPAKVYVQRWDGASTWPLLGAPIDVTNAGAAAPVLAVDGAGRIVVAFTQSDGNHVNT